jgi:two-component system, LytTR family, sensor kinase
MAVRALFVFLFWTLLTIVYSTQAWLIPRPPSERAMLMQQLTWQGLYYMGWAPVTLLVWRLTEKWEPERLGWQRFIGRHALLAAAIGTLHIVGIVLIAYAISPVRLPPNESLADVIWSYSRNRIHLQILTYAAIVGVGQAIAFHNRYRERQVAAARLEAQLTEARLDSLRAQLQPHFLFNSLHSIASLARAGDNAGVVRLISGFSDLLRHLLDTQASHHPLRDELALVDRYLDIQRVRFGDRLRVTIDATPEANAARTPLLIVQPLVENSLRHGLASRIEAGHIEVRARREGNTLVIDVTDDGVGLPEGWSLASAPGTGLKNLASRLEAEYVGRGTWDVGREPLVVENREGSGVRAIVRIPYVTQ